MRLKDRLLLTFLLVMLATLCLAQKQNNGKSSYTRSRFNFNAPRVRGSKARIVCPIFKESKFPYQGIGAKLGDPFALTYKFYANKNFAIAADVGKASSGLYSRYYRSKFNEYVKTDTLTNGATITYVNSRVKQDWMAEVKVLFSFDVKKISPGLQIYGGVGVQAKNTVIEYTYLYFDNTIGIFNQNRFTIGQTTALGVEYSYFHLPVSAFMEMELFTDVYKDPGVMRFQGGVGLRYVFR
jgi:hypothetical protein